MRNRLNARDVVRDVAARNHLPQRVIDEIFVDAPLDFPVVFSRRLPLFADRFGMDGITLNASVWLLESVRSYPVTEFLSLLRHEAEHVRQQRERPAMFYLHYGLDFIKALAAPAADRMGSRFRAAYTGIGHEREAYAAGAKTRKIIERES
ncbi:MAG: hypothetical protein H7X80_12070 [bacterium]|nr:hypothetical protein [Candidatus Kapabacteria bacterium]